ncbi:MAG: ParB/RepB/Spo0J family partition protein, partial [Rickettsiales bacterium]|nr:ParB/RepB/Spo0J family partition protein [Rickettsiales bacterium]
MNSLKNSIEKTSLQNPIFVLKNEIKPDHYVIVDSERRWRACKELNHDKIQCRVVASDSAGYQILSLTQNLQRENLLAIEIAEGYAKLLATMQASDPSVTQKSLMHIHHKKESAISELLKISKLPD